ncbi:MAG: hypothetical protein GYA16_04480 [Spirochaetes bacterium]|nr:hypothetical protein [Spirochaetota bacterium]
MKKIARDFFLAHILIVSCVIVWFMFSGNVFAESVFLKDGTIIEGDIVKETDKATTVKTREGKTVTIQRKDILRMLVNESYKTKMYIMKSSKEVLGVYIVEEDNESYTYRTELQSAEEYKINKDDVLFVSKIPPKDFIDEEVQKKATELGIKKKYPREENLKWRAPFMRFGYSNIGIYIDSDINDAYSESRNINAFIDIFPWRFRNESGNGFDAMIRARFVGNFDEINPTDPRTQTFLKLYQVTIDESYESKLNIGQICGGVRYAYSMYYGVLIQPYVYGLLQLFVFHDEIKIESLNSDAIDEQVSSSKLGYQFGAGVDFGITSYVGLFIEGMYSYIGAKFKDGKTRNVDGYYIYYGVTWRTSYGLIE